MCSSAVRCNYEQLQPPSISSRLQVGLSLLKNIGNPKSQIPCYKNVASMIFSCCRPPKNCRSLAAQALSPMVSFSCCAFGKELLQWTMGIDEDDPWHPWHWIKTWKEPQVTVTSVTFCDTWTRSSSVLICLEMAKRSQENRNTFNGFPHALLKQCIWGMLNVTFNESRIVQHNPGLTLFGRTWSSTLVLCCLKGIDRPAMMKTSCKSHLKSCPSWLTVIRYP